MEYQEPEPRRNQGQGVALWPMAALMVYGERPGSLTTRGYGEFHFLNSFSLGPNNSNPEFEVTIFAISCLTGQSRSQGSPVFVKLRPLRNEVLLFPLVVYLCVCFNVRAHPL